MIYIFIYVVADVTGMMTLRIRYLEINVFWVGCFLVFIAIICCCTFTELHIKSEQSYFCY